MSDPVISYWRWFFSDGGAADGDWMTVSVSRDGGARWAPVDTVRGAHNDWEETTFRVRDFVAPSNQVRVRFVAADFGVGTLVEAAIDELEAYESGTAPVAVGPVARPARLEFRPPAPNPAWGATWIELDLPATCTLEVEVIDLSGRRVATLHRGRAESGNVRLAWNGRDPRGERVPAGIYFVRARAAGATAITRLVRAG
jgi:hypothetical protein